MNTCSPRRDATFFPSSARCIRAQSQGEGLSGGHGVDLDVLEAVDVEADLVEDEQAPAFADDLQRVGDGADPGGAEIGRFDFLTHGATVDRVVSSQIELISYGVIAFRAPRNERGASELCLRS